VRRRFYATSIVAHTAPMLFSFSLCQETVAISDIYMPSCPWSSSYSTFLLQSYSVCVYFCPLPRQRLIHIGKTGSLCSCRAFLTHTTYAGDIFFVVFERLLSLSSCLTNYFLCAAALSLLPSIENLGFPNRSRRRFFSSVNAD
jgi:hypothetical protein